VYSVATKAPSTFTGSSDHLVSQAFYFNDPEGNGIELYWDRDRTAWSWTHGSVEMATLYLDPNVFLEEHLSPELVDDPRGGSAAGAAGSGVTVGHVHLSIGSIAQAHEFYVTQLGFEQTAAFGPSALFVSAGGYHHHMGLNVWNSAGAGRRQRTLGLGQVDVVVPTTDSLLATSERLITFGHDVRHDGQTLFVDDPWGNLIRLTAEPAAL
jgi:catechol 2,3-dioxygenase